MVVKMKKLKNLKEYIKLEINERIFNFLAFLIILILILVVVISFIPLKPKDFLGRLVKSCLILYLIFLFVGITGDIVFALWPTNRLAIKSKCENKLLKLNYITTIFLVLHILTIISFSSAIEYSNPINFAASILLMFIISSGIWFSYTLFCYIDIYKETGEGKRYIFPLILKHIRVVLVALVASAILWPKIINFKINFKTNNTSMVVLNCIVYFISCAASFIYPIIDLYDFTRNIIE